MDAVITQDPDVLFNEAVRAAQSAADGMVPMDIFFSENLPAT